MTNSNIYSNIINEDISKALREDIQQGDLTAQLLPLDHIVQAKVITREPMIVCGIDWFQACFFYLDNSIDMNYVVKDGTSLNANDSIAEISGNARSILSAERCALNFLQTLSATATTTSVYAKKISHTKCKVLDTRKTIPGLRMAQKYAVKIGGGENHRIGLFDAILIKENHIQACGSIEQALKQAQLIKNQSGNSQMMIEIEIENLEELSQALGFGAKRVMLDNFSIEDTRQAVSINESNGHFAKLEASGNIDLSNIVEYAEAGVDFISLGVLTKHVKAIDLSLRIF